VRYELDELADWLVIISDKPLGTSLGLLRSLASAI